MKSPLLIGCLIFLIAVAVVYPEYRYHINPDGTSYLTLAQKYTEGQWFDAISGHWAPLYVWMLALLELLRLTPLMSVAVANIASGILLLWALDRLGVRVGLSRQRRVLLLSIAALYCIYFVVAVVTPDPLTCALLTWYLALVAEGRYLNETRQACMIGLVAGIAYLAKPYAFYFVLLHLTLATLLRIAPDWPRARQAALRVACVYGVMALVALPWIACISWKYGRLTTSTAADFSFRVMGPKWHDPYLVYVGLAPPPNGSAVSYWEDPARLNVPRWSPLESWNNFSYFMGVIVNNVRDVVRWSVGLSLLALPVLGFGIWQFLRKGRDPSIGLLILTILVYPTGYCLQHIDDRYLWPIALWILVLAVRLLPGVRHAGLIAFVVAASFVPYPLFRLQASPRGDKEHELGRLLRDEYSMRGNVASSSRWVQSLHVCFYAGVRYYGVPATGNPAQIREELHRNGIQYLLVWPGTPGYAELSSGMREIDRGDLSGLQVFAVQ